MITITVILLAFAFVCFVLAIFWNPPRVNLIAVGLAFWVLANFWVRTH